MLQLFLNTTEGTLINKNLYKKYNNGFKVLFSVERCHRGSLGCPGANDNELLEPRREEWEKVLKKRSTSSVYFLLSYYDNNPAY